MQNHGDHVTTDATILRANRSGERVAQKVGGGQRARIWLMHGMFEFGCKSSVIQRVRERYNSMLGSVKYN